MSFYCLLRFSYRFRVKPLSVVVMDAIEDDPEKPGPTVGTLAELMKRFPRLEVRLLQDILGDSFIFQLTQRGPIQIVPVRQSFRLEFVDMGSTAEEHSQLLVMQSGRRSPKPIQIFQRATTKVYS